MESIGSQYTRPKLISNLFDSLGSPNTFNDLPEYIQRIIKEHSRNDGQINYLTDMYWARLALGKISPSLKKTRGFQEVMVYIIISDMNNGILYDASNLEG